MFPPEMRAEMMRSLGDDGGASYWSELCPSLHIGDAELLKATEEAVVDPPVELVEHCRGHMAAEGYFRLPSDGPDAVPWTVDIGAMAEGVRRLAGHGWPSSFLLVYDEPWLLALQVSRLVREATGNELIADWAMFHVGGSAPGAGAAKSGWAPHRDRGGDGAAQHFRPDGTPQYSTTWVPLTDATTTNSCLCVVPRQHDPGYHAGDGSVNPLQAVFSRASAFQAVRALPSPAGSVLHFSHRLLHWGSTAAGPRATERRWVHPRPPPRGSPRRRSPAPGPSQPGSRCRLPLPIAPSSGPSSPPICCRCRSRTPAEL